MGCGRGVLVLVVVLASAGCGDSTVADDDDDTADIDGDDRNELVAAYYSVYVFDDSGALPDPGSNGNGNGAPAAHGSAQRVTPRICGCHPDSHRCE